MRSLRPLLAAIAGSLALLAASPAAANETAPGITGDNSATWNPTITVAVPGGMAANVYSATITHSVL